MLVIEPVSVRHSSLTPSIAVVTISSRGFGTKLKYLFVPLLDLGNFLRASWMLSFSINVEFFGVVYEHSYFTSWFVRNNNLYCYMTIDHESFVFTLGLPVWLNCIVFFIFVRVCILSTYGFLCLSEVDSSGIIKCFYLYNITISFNVLFWLTCDWKSSLEWRTLQNKNRVASWKQNESSVTSFWILAKLLIIQNLPWHANDLCAYLIKPTHLSPLSLCSDLIKTGRYLNLMLGDFDDN